MARERLFEARRDFGGHGAMNDFIGLEFANTFCERFFVVPEIGRCRSLKRRLNLARAKARAKFRRLKSNCSDSLLLLQRLDVFH